MQQQMAKSVRPVRNFVMLLSLVLILFAIFSKPARAGNDLGAGALRIVGKNGVAADECPLPLKHTDVKAAISGSVARVVVIQEFQNTGSDTIEALYVFPLPHSAAVDDMTMHVGDAVIRGIIKPRKEAAQIYATARRSGQVAALLDQERPNIFTQSVANITPGAIVKIEISYVQVLDYENNEYEFVFPMTVGPRYIPGTPNADYTGTNKVPDAGRITPPTVDPGQRSGHDISLTLALDSGIPLASIRSVLHKAVIQKTGVSSATVALENQNSIPNRDFILRYKVVGTQIADAVLTHTRGKGDGYFALMLQPPERFAETDVTPKELVFVLDTSGSMTGFPIEKGKELIDLALRELRPNDTFNLITFAGDTKILFDEPVSATPENMQVAREFLAGRSGGGGTEMMKAIRAALEPSDKQEHLRIVCFVTDGEVGNDFEIINEVRSHPNARVFSFGIGQSVNRFLLENIAREGRGEAEFVTLGANAEKTAHRLYERLRSPLLTDITVDFGKLPVREVVPAHLPDLFAARPLVIYGRYTGSAHGTITLHGTRAGQPWQRQIEVDLPAQQSGNAVLASLWARKKIDQVMARDLMGIQHNSPKPEIEKEITQLGIDYKIMTQFTSFVAVDERMVTNGGDSRTVEVPVDAPAGSAPINGSLMAYGQMAGGIVNAPPPPSPGYMGGNKGAQQTVEVTASSPMVAMDAARLRKDVPLEHKARAAATPAKKTERDAIVKKLDNRLLEAWYCNQLAQRREKPPASCTLAWKNRVRVKIDAVTPSPSLLTALKKLGFVPENRSQLVGTIDVANLGELAKLAEVNSVNLAVALMPK